MKLIGTEKSMNESANDKVIAWLYVANDVIYSLGEGVYVGDEAPPEDVIGINYGHPISKIVLDSGEVVYGCECWWGPKDVMEKSINGRKVINVSIVAEREYVANKLALGGYVCKEI